MGERGCAGGCTQEGVCAGGCGRERMFRRLRARGCVRGLFALFVFFIFFLSV